MNANDQMNTNIIDCVFSFSKQTDDKSAYRRNQMQKSALYYRDGEFSVNKENTSILVNGQERSGSRKRKMFGEPDSPVSAMSSIYVQLFSLY